MANTALQTLIYQHIGTEDIIAAMRELARRAESWPKQAIFPADLLRLADAIEHDALLEAAEERSMNWQLLLATMEADAHAG